jgi:hypothetical protein
VSPKYQVSVTSCNNVDGRHTKMTKKSENAKLKINILTTVCICKLLQITKQTNASFSAEFIEMDDNMTSNYTIQNITSEINWCYENCQPCVGNVEQICQKVNKYIDHRMHLQTSPNNKTN